MDNVVMDLKIKSQIRNPKSEIVAESDRIEKQIVCKLTAFDKAIEESKILEIDGLAIDGKPCAEVTQESKIKVINHALQTACEVSVDAIVRQPLNDLILALETGLFYRLQGVTRIVGYYSRINNWNKSKVGELADRRQGNYWADKRVNTEKVGSLGE